MENVKLTRGSAVSIDAIGSTKLFEDISKSGKESGNYRIFKIINRMHKAIKYAVGSTNGKVVHYTGDGALVFFEDIDEMTSAEQAIRFGIDFSCIWRRWKAIFDDLKKADLNFRISIDYGDVIMRDDGGLWSGLVLNHACKIRLKKNDKNRVIITSNVKKALPEKNLYKNLFSEIPRKDVEKDCGTGKLYCMTLSSDGLKEKNSNLDTLFVSEIPVSEKILNWVVCVLGIHKEKYQIELVLKSISLQSYLPKCVVIVGEKSVNDSITVDGFRFNTVFIDKSTLKNTSRAAVRNFLQNYAIKAKENYDMICFLDGDTLIKQSVFKKAYNIYNTNRDCLISAERIDFDYSLERAEARAFSYEFLNNDVTQYIRYYRFLASFYNQSEKNTNLSASEKCHFLPSYLLFVPIHLARNIGDWDENFEGWGEEDIDYTFRAYKRGYSLIMPLLPGYMTMHLSHDNGDSSLLTNAQYLLSKYPELRDERTDFYDAIGL